jgi:MFS family permease
MGRQTVFASTVAMFSLRTGLARLTMPAGFIVAARFPTGLVLGGMAPIDQALIAEFAPAHPRPRQRDRSSVMADRDVRRHGCDVLIGPRNQRPNSGSCFAGP